MTAPWTAVPDEFTDVMGGAMSSPVIMDTTEGPVMGTLGAPHVAFAGLIAGYLLLKLIQDKGLKLGSIARPPIDLWEFLKIGVASALFDLSAKQLNAAGMRRGIVLPGVPDLLGSL